MAGLQLGHPRGQVIPRECFSYLLTEVECVYLAVMVPADIMDHVRTVRKVIDAMKAMAKPQSMIEAHVQIWAFRLMETRK